MHAAAEMIKETVKVCMFDQYGTVVDMQGGLTAAVAPYLKAKGWSGNPGAFVTWWRRTHFENSMIDALLHREHTPYREIGQRSVAHVLERAGIPYAIDEVRHLVAEIERLKPFPEVPGALARLQTRYRIVVLSNGDPDMLESAKAHHGIPFDAVISVAAAELVQAAHCDLFEGGGDPWAAEGSSPVRRQPRVRLHRGQIGRDARRFHRSPPPTVRHDAASARHLVPTMTELADAIA